MRAPEDFGVESGVHFLEGAVVGSAFHIAGHNDDFAFGCAGPDHVFGVDEQQALAGFDEDLGRWNCGLFSVRLRGVAEAIHETFEALGGAGVRFDFAAGALDGFGDACFVEGLEDVVDGIYVEGLDGVVIECSGENDVRHAHFLFDKALEDTETVEAGHVDVEKNEVGRMFFDEINGFDAVFTLCDQIDFGEAFEKVREFFARGTFVVNDERVDGHSNFWAEKSSLFLNPV